MIRRNFSPGAYSPALWLDAADPATLYQSAGGSLATANADPVGQWRDKSANGRHCEQATAAKIPTLRAAVQNGLNVVRFDGGDVLAHAEALLVAGGQYTIYAVYRGAPELAEGCMFHNGATNNGYGLGFGGSGGVMVAAADYLTAAKQGVAWVPTGLFHQTLGVMAATYDGTGATGDTAFWRDGVAGTAAGGGKIVDATDGTFVGAGSLTTLFATVDLCEVLLYTTKHDAATRLRFEAYLRSKWGMP